MNLLHLEYFYAVVNEGGYTKASEKLRISQPAISRMVAQLEEYLGLKLFEKIGRKVFLTPKGEEVFLHCKKIFNEVKFLEDRVGQLKNECKGPLVIGASEPIASHFLPEKFSLLLEKHPDIYPNLISAPSSILLKKIEMGELDLGLFFYTPRLSDKLIIEKEIPISFRLVVRKEYQKNLQTLGFFVGSREIDDTRAKDFPVLGKLKKKYPNAKVRLSSNSLTAHKEFVLRGVGVSILPEFLIEAELKLNILRDVLPFEKFKFNLKIIKRKNAVLSVSASKLMELL